MPSPYWDSRAVLLPTPSILSRVAASASITTSPDAPAAHPTLTSGQNSHLLRIRQGVAHQDNGTRSTERGGRLTTRAYVGFTFSEFVPVNRYLP